VKKKISESQSFALAAKELGIKEKGSELRARHLSFQKLNRPVFALAKRLQAQGYKILLLSKNTPGQFREAAGRFGLQALFPLINTYYLPFDKQSPRMIRYIIKKYSLKPEEVVMTDDQDFNLVYPKKIGVSTILYTNITDLKQKLKAVL